MTFFPSAQAFLAWMLDPANLAGAFAVCCSCTWPLLRQRRAILGVQVVGSGLFALHYLLLGAPTAAAMCAAGVVQGLAAALVSGRALRLGLFAAALAGAAALTLATWAGLPSLLAQCGQLGSAAGRLQRDLQRLRLCFLGSLVFWVSHNLLMGSVWGLAADTLSLTALIAGLWRNRRRRSGVAAGARLAPRLASGLTPARA
jgi:hypothetical protein